MWAVDHQRLPMWVVYDSPSDKPGQTLVRLHYTMPKPEPTDRLIVGPLPTIRAALSGHGYTCIGRQPEDEMLKEFESRLQRAFFTTLQQCEKEDDAPNPVR